MARNYLRFRSDKVMLHPTKFKIASSVALSGNISKGNCLFGHDDNNLLDSFSGGA